MTKTCSDTLMVEAGASTLDAVPKCHLCDGHGTITVNPSVLGWVYLWEKIWRKPDGHTFTFPITKRELLVCLCPDCYPSHWDLDTIN